MTQTEAMQPLTAEAMAERPRSKYPPQAIEELRKLCASNDARPFAERLSREDAIELLASHGVHVRFDTLNKICRQLGRRSYRDR